MPRTLVLADSTVGRADLLAPALHCSWADGGLDAAGWLAWGGTLHWQDLFVLAIT